MTADIIGDDEIDRENTLYLSVKDVLENIGCFFDENNSMTATLLRHIGTDDLYKFFCYVEVKYDSDMSHQLNDIRKKMIEHVDAQYDSSAHSELPPAVFPKTNITISKTLLDTEYLIEHFGPQTELYWCRYSYTSLSEGVIIDIDNLKSKNEDGWIPVEKSDVAGVELNPWLEWRMLPELGVECLYFEGLYLSKKSVGMHLDKAKKLLDEQETNDWVWENMYPELGEGKFNGIDLSPGVYFGSSVADVNLVSLFNKKTKGEAE
jgi:hypothetical protein